MGNNIMINSHNYKIIDKILENDFSKIYKVLNEKEKKYYYIKQISINNLGEEEIKYRNHIILSFFYSDLIIIWPCFTFFLNIRVTFDYVRCNFFVFFNI